MTWLNWEMWGISALILLGAEVWIQNFVFLWPAIAAAATAVAALFGVSENGQIILFSILSMVLLALSRSVFRTALFPVRRRSATDAAAGPGSSAEGTRGGDTPPPR